MASDPDESVLSAYMVAAGEFGIPTAFIIGPTGHIEWIGETADVETVVTAVLAGSWDRQTFADQYKAKQDLRKLIDGALELAAQGQLDEARAILTAAKTAAADALTVKRIDGEIQEASVVYARWLAETGKIDDAWSVLEALRMAKDPEQQRDLQILQLGVLMEFSDSTEKIVAAMRAVTAQASEPKSLQGIAAKLYHDAVKTQKTWPPEILAAGRQAAEKAVTLEPTEATALDALTRLMYLQGDVGGAAAVQAKAIAADRSDRPEIREFYEQLQRELAAKILSE